jgi:hypothetical protein
MLSDALKTLSRLVERSLQVYESSTKRIAFTRVAIDCNADYGSVFVAIDTSTSFAPNDVLFSELGEEFYSFGDWAIPDVTDTSSFIKQMWADDWEPYQRVIRDDWLDLPEIEHELRKKRLLEGICRAAAEVSNGRASLQIPILVADHDEHIRHTTSRLKWAYMGAPSSSHSEISENIWQCRAKHYQGDELLMFSHDGQFVNGIVIDDDNELAPICEGDWMLDGSTLRLITTHTNFDDNEDIIWKELRYDVSKLNAESLYYRDEDGTYWEYHRLDTTF